MNILITDGLSESGKKILADNGHNVIENKIAREHLADFINENMIDVLIVRSSTQVDDVLIDDCPSLKIIGRAGVGTDNIAVEHAKNLGIEVINTPNASSRSVAELVFAHFFSLARNLHESNRLMPLEGETNFKSLKKSFSNAYELEGKTLGVIGFGSIGTEVVKMGISLGMKVKVLTRKPIEKTIELDFYDGQKVEFKITSTNNWDTFLEGTQFISINTPKTEEYIIDTPQLDKMMDGVYIVNTARGGVINEKALLEAIDDGKVIGAALDVYESEPQPELSILMNPSLSLSPHLGGNTADAQEKIGIEIANKINSLV